MLYNKLSYLGGLKWHIKLIQPRALTVARAKARVRSVRFLKKTQKELLTQLSALTAERALLPARSTQ
jgi:hypothetical protein